jgi:hypothetical protein
MITKAEEAEIERRTRPVRASGARRSRTSTTCGSSTRRCSGIGWSGNGRRWRVAGGRRPSRSCGRIQERAGRRMIDRLRVSPRSRFFRAVALYCPGRCFGCPAARKSCPVVGKHDPDAQVDHGEGVVAAPPPIVESRPLAIVNATVNGGRRAAG